MASRASRPAADFTVVMRNALQFADCAAPDVAVSDPLGEWLEVVLAGNLLTICALGSQGGRGNTLYAHRTVVVAGITTFMILPAPPDGRADPSFFSAIGTVAVFVRRGLRHLRAVGTDTQTGECRAWIFDAVETGRDPPGPQH
jgi:hypothetical protein